MAPSIRCLIVSALLLFWPLRALAQIDAHSEVAAALYAASATQAAAERLADARLRAQRKEIEGLRAALRAGDARLRAQLTAAEEAYVAALSARDRAYAQEIAVFRAAVSDIAATPEGLAALARFNAGDEAGALAILDDLRRARDAARQKRADLESAAEGRRIATLALDALQRGKQGTAALIARFEEVTRLDPGVHWDWIELGRLYRRAGRLADARRAAEAAARTAEDDRERAVASSAQGDVLQAQGDGPGALAAYRRSHTLHETLAARDAQNSDWQRDLSVSHERIGDVLRAQGDGPGALAAYRRSLALRETLAARDPSNAEWQRDRIVSYVRLRVATGEREWVLKALQLAQSLQQDGRLAPRDARMIDILKELAGQ